MTSALVDELKNRAIGAEKLGLSATADLLNEAIEFITTQADALAAKEAELNEARAQLAALPAVRDALAELVALKDWKERLEHLHNMGHGTDWDGYRRRQPLAWKQARAALDALRLLAALPASAPSAPD